MESEGVAAATTDAVALSSPPEDPDFSTIGSPDSHLQEVPQPSDDHPSSQTLALTDDHRDKIINQVENYFSDENLLTDNILMKYVTKEKEGFGWIPTEEKEEGENNVVKFLDSMDSYLILLDSLSFTLRQGWLELASARHSMGASRINSALFDLKYHSAATSLQVTLCDEFLAPSLVSSSVVVDSSTKQPHFTLCKWLSPDNKKCCSEEVKFDEDELLQRKSTSPQLRHRGVSQYPGIWEKKQESNGSPLTVDNQAQKERSKLLSMFGALVSPKLRAAQLSFETALETLVEIANMRSSILSAYHQVQKEMESTMG